MSLQLVFLAVVAAFGVFLVTWGWMSRPSGLSKEALYRQRLARYGAAEAKLSPEELALATTSLYERMAKPQIDKLQGWMTSLTSSDYRKKVEIDLAFAGSSMGYGDFILVRFAAPALGVLVAAGLGVLGLGLTGGILMAVFLGLVGLMAPKLMLKSAISRQRHQYSRALPDLIDFLVVTVEAGLGFDQAVERVITKFDNALTRAFATVVREIELGRPRNEAYEALAARSGVEALHAFIQTVLTSEKMGTPMGHTLRQQSDDVRWRRREKAKELGAKAALKMTVPMVGFIFPAIWVVLLGPALFSILKSGI
jgi:tight adherence protein C